jgi:hypothetical protein
MSASAQWRARGCDVKGRLSTLSLLTNLDLANAAELLRGSVRRYTVRSSAGACATGTSLPSLFVVDSPKKDSGEGEIDFPDDAKPRPRQTPSTPALLRGPIRIEVRSSISGRARPGQLARRRGGRPVPRLPSSRAPGAGRAGGARWRRPASLRKGEERRERAEALWEKAEAGTGTSRRWHCARSRDETL